MASPDGSCLCGRVSFTAASEPLAVLACYCVHCSKGAGGPGQVIAKLAESDVNIVTGHDAIARCVLDDTSSGAPKEKFFCSSCGSTLWTVPAGVKGKFLMVRATLLSNWTKLQPAAEIFVKYRPAWAVPVVGALQFQEARH
ncbi:hypothetical protein SEUCBS140593_010704 [Sporothrix eucalyptigena]|uniref:CENP-V/GFA domain-containing protein n=1 Tax=Sporothrix eucalyptigena TaxID=1812306 RepID=A0ABP0D4T9_9PEZI